MKRIVIFILNLIQAALFAAAGAIWMRNNPQLAPFWPLGILVGLGIYGVSILVRFLVTRASSNRR